MKIGRLLEYDSGGDLREACHCITELSMPFFDHEVVKKALVAPMQRKNSRWLWDLLVQCFVVGLITMDQMADFIDDLALDFPGVETQCELYVDMARHECWLNSSSFSSTSGSGDSILR